jgi:iron complex transport system substrate-binding protein
MKFRFFALVAVLAVHTSTSAFATLTVQDDKGSTVTLQRPAQRVVTLSPHATELVYAAGGGARIVGTVKYSEYPPAAKSIPRVGDNRMVDIERLVAAKPDLIVVWRHNAAERQMEQLRKLGIPIFYSEPNLLEDIPDNILRLGTLLGTEQQAGQQARAFRQEMEALAGEYSQRPVVRVFYQLWDKPMYTLSDRNIVSDVIRLCGGKNIFGALPLAAPVVTVEAVLLENPDAIVASTGGNRSSDGITHWKPYQGMAAVRNGNLFTVDGDLLNRPGPRILEGASALCAHLEQARKQGGPGEPRESRSPRDPRP